MNEKFTKYYRCTLLKGTKEIAETFGVSMQTVRNWQIAGAPISIAGTRRTAILEDVQAWLIAKTQEKLGIQK